MRVGTYLGVLMLTVLLGGCPPDEEPSDAGCEPPPSDAGVDSGAHDAGVDAGPGDAGPDDGGPGAMPRVGSGIGLSSGSGTATSTHFRIVVDVGGHAPVGATASPSYRVSFGAPQTP